MRLFLIFIIGLTLFSNKVESQNRFTKLDTFIESCMLDYHIPGLSVGVVEGDKIVYLKGYGMADNEGRKVTAQTPFYLASVTKSFTAIVVMQMVESGLLNLDMPVRNYIPWFSMKDGKAGYHASDSITLRNLLNHTSGIAGMTGQVTQTIDYDKSDALELQVRSFANVDLVNKPGSTFRYANANYQIAGLVVQTISNKSIEDIFIERIFKPLKMKHSHTSQINAEPDGLALGHRIWFGHPIAFSNYPYNRGHFPGAYAISSAEDICHYLIAQMNNGMYEDSSVVSPESMDIMHKPILNDYGMGWYSKDGVLEHNGQLEAYGSHLFIDLINNRGIVLLFNVNRWIGCHHLYEMAASVSKLLNGETVSKAPVYKKNATLFQMLFGLILLISIWFYLSITKLCKWTKKIYLFIQGWKFWFFLIFPLIIEGLIIMALFNLLPVAIPLAILYSPDAMSLWLIACISLAGWGLIRTIWLVWLFVNSKKSNRIT